LSLEGGVRKIFLWTEVVLDWDIRARKKYAAKVGNKGTPEYFFMVNKHDSVVIATDKLVAVTYTECLLGP
jgi:hypothetical protein